MKRLIPCVCYCFFQQFTDCFNTVSLLSCFIVFSFETDGGNLAASLWGLNWISGVWCAVIRAVVNVISCHPICSWNNIVLTHFWKKVCFLFQSLLRPLSPLSHTGYEAPAISWLPWLSMQGEQQDQLFVQVKKKKEIHQMAHLITFCWLNFSKI